MKKLLLAGVALLSLNAFSQSYMILGNGVTLTTDKNGLVYDFGNFNLPYKVTVNGGQFMVVDDKLATVDTQGYFYHKDEKIKDIRFKGYNFMINKGGDMISIDENGFFYRFDKDVPFKKTISAGGNYLLVKNDKNKTTDLYTVNSRGLYFNPAVPGLNASDIIQTSGNYFTTRLGGIYTVAKDGIVYSKDGQYKIGGITRMGGNFFIDSSNSIYTVTEAGFLMNPMIPKNLVVSKITKTGANYMIDSDGKLFTVDTVTGAINERTAATKDDLRNTKVLSI